MWVACMPKIFTVGFKPGKEGGGGGGVLDQCLGIGVPLRYVKMR